MKKRISLLVAMLILAMSIVTGCNVTTTDQQKETTAPTTVLETTAPTEDEKSETVTIALDCKTVLDNMDKLDSSIKDSDVLPKDGVILKETEVEIEKDATVFDVLEKVTKENKIQFEYVGAEESSFGSLYIEGINYLYSMSCGENSGWFFLVNGEFASVGCDAYKVKAGDKIEWRYTCDMGADIGYVYEGE